MAARSGPVRTSSALKASSILTRTAVATHLCRHFLPGCKSRSSFGAQPGLAIRTTGDAGLQQSSTQITEDDAEQQGERLKGGHLLRCRCARLPLVHASAVDIARAEGQRYFKTTMCKLKVAVAHVGSSSALLADSIGSAEGCPQPSRVTLPAPKASAECFNWHLSSLACANTSLTMQGRRDGRM